MPFPKPPDKIVAFNSGAVAPHDIGRQFDEHRRAAGEVINFLRTIARDDGTVKNGSVGPEQLAPELPETLAKTAVGAVEGLLAQVRQSAALAARHVAEAQALREELGALWAAMAQQVSAMQSAAADAREASAQASEQVAAARAQISALSTSLATGMLGVGAGGFYGVDALGAGATAQDYAQVSIEWAEHMPDIIPPNVLAINAISGDHWSSRWWANRAAGIISGSSGIVGSVPAGQGVFAEPVAVTAPNVCAPLSHTPNGPVLLVVNGVSLLPVGTTPPFTMSGTTINWFSSIYSLIPGQTEVAAWYPYTPP